LAGHYFKSVLYQFLKSCFWGFLGWTICAYIWQAGQIGAILLAHGLSFIFVVSNFLVVHNFRDQSCKRFYRQFYIVLSVRFFLVIVALVVILETTKFHQIYFTVSFIISYILHSVIEVISINKMLEN
jgi:phosphatidylserine synthase